MFTVETELADVAWKTILKHILDNGDEIEDERDLITKELLNVLVTVKDPMNSEPQMECFSSAEKFKKIENQFLDPKNIMDGINYGKRLREHFGFKLGRDVYSVKTDQIETVLNRLQKSETTRRATLTAFDPGIDQYQDDIPSMIMVDFKIRKNRLFVTSAYRSHDIYNSWIPNFYGLRGLSKFLSDSLNIKMGPLTILSVSAHIYKANYEDVKKLIGVKG
jgi:thymidylate synthase